MELEFDEAAMSLPKQVLVREVGPREGLQTTAKIVPTAQKLELIQALLRTGVKEIEVTSFVRPDRVPQMADAEDLACLLPSEETGRLRALYLNEKGFLRARDTGAFNNHGWIYTSASATFLKKNNNCTKEDVLTRLPGWLSLFSDTGTPLQGVMISNAFGCAYEGAVEVETVISDLKSIISLAEKHGAAFPEVSLADTVGYAHPLSVSTLVKAVRAEFPGCEVSLHLHDTRGTGLACVYAGLLEGVSIFESSIGGVGGCPFTPGAAGNICTEDMVYMFHSLGIETGINLEAYVIAAKLLAGILGKELPGKYYRAASSGR